MTVAQAAQKRSSTENRFSFSAPIQRTSVGFAYRLGLVISAIVLLALPILYVAIIATVGWGVWLHIVNDVGMLKVAGRRAHGRVILFLLLLYIAPIIVGAILILFMIKPLFTRRVKSGISYSIERHEEPGLYGLVDRLCAVVGAPKPSQIVLDTEVNASASFREGLFGWIRKDLVLTIGLPIAAGLSARQFVGVLAHEFGHFAQGGGMRVSFLVRSINIWFARMVYERDAWDEYLSAMTEGDTHWAVALIVGLARLFIWLTRRILQLLMFIGFAVSSFLLRQMEFDADRYEARVVGSDAAIATFDRMAALGLASQAAMADLETAWREKRLPDDLPLLIHHREVEMPADLRKALDEAERKAKTGWFDTHPCSRDRIESIRRENAPGVFTAEAPASEIFTDFPELSKMATVAFYTDQLGDRLEPEHIVPTPSLVQHHAEQRQSFDAMERYFCGLLHPLWPIFPSGSIQPTKDADAAAEKLLSLRTRFADQLPTATRAAEKCQSAQQKMTSVLQARAIQLAGIKVDLKAVELPAADEKTLESIDAQAKAQQSRDKPALDEALAVGMERLGVALSLAMPAAEAVDALEVDGGEYVLSEAPAGSIDHLLDALNVLRSASDTMRRLREHFIAFQTLLSFCRPDHNSQSLISAVLSRAGMTHKDLKIAFEALRGSAFPYTHGEKRISIGRHLIPSIPAADEVGSLASAAERALDEYDALYGRLMADLSQRAEAAEAELGLSPVGQIASQSN